MLGTHANVTTLTALSLLSAHATHALAKPSFDHPHSTSLVTHSAERMQASLRTTASSRPQLAQPACKCCRTVFSAPATSCLPQLPQRQTASSRRASHVPRAFGSGMEALNVVSQLITTGALALGAWYLMEQSSSAYYEQVRSEASVPRSWAEWKWNGGHQQQRRVVSPFKRARGYTTLCKPHPAGRGSVCSAYAMQQNDVASRVGWAVDTPAVPQSHRHRQGC